MKIKQVLLGLFLGIAGTSLGQMNMMGAGEYMPMIFFNPAVVKDMHLSPAVAQKETTVLMEKVMALAPLVMKQTGSGQDSGKMESAVLKAYREMTTATLAPLNSSQRLRYHQLSLQFIGPSALAMPKESAAVGLSATQKTRLFKLIQKTTKGMAGGLSMMGGKGNVQGAMGSLKQTRAAQEAGLRSILTSAQWAKWSALQGKKLPGMDNPFSGLGGGMGLGF